VNHVTHGPRDDVEGSVGRLSQVPELFSKNLCSPRRSSMPRRHARAVGSGIQANGFSIRYADGGAGAAGITSSPGLDERMPRNIGITPADALYPSSKPFWKE
jgi:hypothetical protein